MKIYLGADHAGFLLKEEVKRALIEEMDYSRFDVVDMGAYTLVPSDSYVPIMEEVALKVQSDAFHDPSVAIIFGGTGTGEAIVANRYAHVRAVVFNNNPLDIVRLGREHNDANVLSVGARFVNVREAMSAIDVFLNTQFSHDERHSERIISIDYIDDLDED